MRPLYESESSRNVERRLAQADQELNDAFAQTPDEVREMEVMFGSTPRELPAALRDGNQVLEQIKKAGMDLRSPSALGKLITLLRTEQRLTIEQLAAKTDLDVEDIEEVETCIDAEAEPMVVSVLATFFKLQPKKLQQLAGLTRESTRSDFSESLGMAACAKPEFDKLSKSDQKLFHQWVKQLRR